jgi:hypothetical protein
VFAALSKARSQRKGLVNPLAILTRHVLGDESLEMAETDGNLLV